MTHLHVQDFRNGVVESVHRVSVAVVTADGDTVAFAGDPNLVTFMRSAAKPFQALPLVRDGVVGRFQITSQELALACASHNGDQHQVDLVRAFLTRLGCSEADLACGPHRPLARDLSVAKASEKETGTNRRSRLTSNCSGKHTGMLALALHHGWETAGYHEAGHPVQRRMKEELARYTGVPETGIGEGVDGCGVVTFSLPVSKMALGVSRLIADQENAARTVVDAMLQHPDLVAGQGRLCTELMSRYSGKVLAKGGAQGVYAAALLDRGVGIGLKVEDGSNRAAIVALVAVLDQLGLEPSPRTHLSEAITLPTLNTRGERVGEMCAAGELSFV